MISDAIGRAALAVKAGIAGVVIALGVPPNVLTLSSLVPMILAAWNLGHGRLGSAGLWLVAGGTLDLIDGAVARASGQASPFGGVLDSVVDRASDTLIFVGAVYYFYVRGASVHVTLTAVALGGDTDTIAAMAGALAAARLGPEGLPARRLDRLEARDELIALSDDLVAATR